MAVFIILSLATVSKSNAHTWLPSIAISFCYIMGLLYFPAVQRTKHNTNDFKNKLLPKETVQVEQILVQKVAT